MAESDRFGITFKGLDELESKLRAMAGTMLSDVGNALRAEAEIEMTEAKRRTPVLTGALRASGHVEGPSQSSSSMVSYDQGERTFIAAPDAGNISVRLVFGGPAAAYAVYVHENVEAYHKNGQAKYLESTLLESAPYLAARVAARMAKK